MLIGVLADTHDRLPLIDAALELFDRRHVKAVIHAGDFVAPFAVRRLLRYPGPLYATYGNNDGERAGLKTLLPQLQDGPLFVSLAARSILVHHFIDWCTADNVARADIIITGHTHQAGLETRDGKLFLNPGECCGWVSGRCTAALIDLNTLTAEILDLPHEH